MSHCGVASFLACKRFYTILPIHVKYNVYLWNGLIDATGLKYVDTELFNSGFNYGYKCYLSRLDSIGSICIKAVASKIMNSVFSIMLLYLQICFWVNGWNLVIDSSHSFWKYFKTPCAFSKDKIPPWKSKLLTNTDASPNHSWLHCCIFGMSASVLLLTFCLGS